MKRETNDSTTTKRVLIQRGKGKAEAKPKATVKGREKTKGKRIR